MAKKKINVGHVQERLTELQVETWPIDKLIPNEYNPNRQSDHEFELLKRSITDDGMTQPVLVMRATGQIVDGEHRWRACKELGYTEIPVVPVDMTEEQRRVATLRHNLARGSHDIDLTANVLRDLQNLGALDWARDALQLDQVEVDRLLADMTPVQEWGQNEQFSEGWDYHPAGDMAQSSSAAQQIEAARKAMQGEMDAGDVKLKKRSMVLTDAQENAINQLGDGDRATVTDRLVAMAEAHMKAKTRSGTEWTTLTFVVPTGALLAIEQELDRLMAHGTNRRTDLTIELQRGLALELMAALSAQTPTESME